MEVDGHLCPAFQCDNPSCVVKVRMFGEDFDGALTFAVDPAGRPFDPASSDGSLPRPAKPADA